MQGLGGRPTQMLEGLDLCLARVGGGGPEGFPKLLGSPCLVLDAGLVARRWSGTSEEWMWAVISAQTWMGLQMCMAGFAVM